MKNNLNAKLFLRLKFLVLWKAPNNFTGIVEYPDGDKFWYSNGILHREDGPACEYVNGNKQWFLNGKRHRTDGPAIECSNGDKYWYLNGFYYPENQRKKENEKLNDKSHK